MKLWQGTLGQLTDEQMVANARSEDKLTKRNEDRIAKQRKPLEVAVTFWQRWLQNMHSMWDGQDELTFLLASAHMTLPKALYKVSIPLPPGMSEAIGFRM